MPGHDRWRLPGWSGPRGRFRLGVGIRAGRGSGRPPRPGLLHQLHPGKPPLGGVDRRAAGGRRLHHRPAGLGLPARRRLPPPDAAGHHLVGADDRGAVAGLLRLAVRGGRVAGGVRQGPDRGGGVAGAGAGPAVPAAGAAGQPGVRRPGRRRRGDRQAAAAGWSGGVGCPADHRAVPRRGKRSEAVSRARPRDQQPAGAKPPLLGSW
jgi:hypothetical protein